MHYSNIKYIMIKIRTLKKIFYQMPLSLKVLFKGSENNISFSSTITLKICKSESSKRSSYLFFITESQLF